MKKAPRCPYCKERISKVLEYDHVIYVFDSVSGTYRADDGDLEVRCFYCDAKLYDVFPDGVCNYGK